MQVDNLCRWYNTSGTCIRHTLSPVIPAKAGIQDRDLKAPANGAPGFSAFGGMTPAWNASVNANGRWYDTSGSCVRHIPYPRHPSESWDPGTRPKGTGIWRPWILCFRGNDARVERIGQRQWPLV
jgi:hypothetical protein